MFYSKVCVIILLIAFCGEASIHIQKILPRHPKTTVAPTSTTTLATTKATDVKTCECAVFAELVPASYDEPVAVRTISHNMSCNARGERSCSNQCKSIIKKSKKSPDGLCSFFNKVYNKMLAISVRVCQRRWVFIGLTIKNTLCCEDGKRVDCIDYCLLVRSGDKFPVF